MTRVLRKSTERKTAISKHMAAENSYFRKPRERTGRLASLKIPKQFHHISTITNPTKSAFLRLPAEIKGRIFDLAMTYDPPPIDKNRLRAVMCQEYISFSGNVLESCYMNPHTGALNNKRNLSDTLVWPDLDKTRVAAALPRVCRQIYAETATRMYSLNTFYFSNEHLLQKWLATLLPAQRRAINHIIFNRGKVGRLEYVNPEILDKEERKNVATMGPLVIYKDHQLYPYWRSKWAED